MIQRIIVGHAPFHRPSETSALRTLCQTFPKHDPSAMTTPPATTAAIRSCSAYHRSESVLLSLQTLHLLLPSCPSTVRQTHIQFGCRFFAGNQTAPRALFFSFFRLAAPLLLVFSVRATTHASHQLVAADILEIVFVKQLCFSAF